MVKLMNSFGSEGKSGMDKETFFSLIVSECLKDSKPAVSTNSYFIMISEPPKAVTPDGRIAYHGLSEESMDRIYARLRDPLIFGGYDYQRFVISEAQGSFVEVLGKGEVHEPRSGFIYAGLDTLEVIIQDGNPHKFLILCEREVLCNYSEFDLNFIHDNLEISISRSKLIIEG